MGDIVVFHSGQRNDNPIKRSDTGLRKNIPLTLLKCCMWEGVGDRTELQHIDPHSIGHNRVFSRSSGLLNRWPGGPASLGHVPQSSIFSPKWLIGGLRASSAGCWLSLTHLVSNWSGLQTNWLPVFTELYNSSPPTQSLMHFRRLWNDMFDLPRSEITVMQFTGHSLPVHQFVTVPWDFNPILHCQPSSPTPMGYRTSAVFGIACLAGSEVKILQYLSFWTSLPYHIFARLIFFAYPPRCNSGTVIK